MSNPRPRISVIVGSARPVRVGRQLSDAVASVIRDAVDADVQLLDLREIGLPMLDEQFMAGMDMYQNPHTLTWARQISESDAVVFVTPQYNAGYPASLKNAIDYLLKEWKGKPAAIVSYGGHGGGAAAKQLREVLAFIGTDLVPADLDLAITLGRDDYREDWFLADGDAVAERNADGIRAIADAVAGKLAALAPASV